MIFSAYYVILGVYSWRSCKPIGEVCIPINNLLPTTIIDTPCVVIVALRTTFIPILQCWCNMKQWPSTDPPSISEKAISIYCLSYPSNCDQLSVFVWLHSVSKYSSLKWSKRGIHYRGEIVAVLCLCLIMNDTSQFAGSQGRWQWCLTFLSANLDNGLDNLADDAYAWNTFTNILVGHLGRFKVYRHVAKPRSVSEFPHGSFEPDIIVAYLKKLMSVSTDIWRRTLVSGNNQGVYKATFVPKSSSLGNPF